MTEEPSCIFSTLPAQSLPMNSAGQVHSNSLPTSAHVPALWQGFGWHRLLSITIINFQGPDNIYRVLKNVVWKSLFPLFSSEKGHLFSGRNNLFWKKRLPPVDQPHKYRPSINYWERKFKNWEISLPKSKKLFVWEIKNWQFSLFQGEKNARNF